MIKIENLTKIYTSKKKYKTVALENIDLVLPNKGLVFIIGKSGSGKSTLLNIISGLDSISSGSVICDSINVSTLKGNDLQDYLSSYIGFIFQDYHLIEDLTVKENLSLVLEKNHQIDIDAILTEFGLEGYADKKINELSGGEAQRVGVIRALIKKPHIVLADEPTGNLDAKSSEIVLNTLKKISKEKLVVIVSHNLDDAFNYADRIIELSEGKIVSDKVRKERSLNIFEIKDSTVYFPYNRDLTEEETKQLYQNKNNITKVIQRTSAFKKNKAEIVEEMSVVNTHKFSLSRTCFRKMFKIFNTQGLIGKIQRILFAVILISCLYAFLSFNNYNEIDSCLNYYSEYEMPLYQLQKGTLNSKKMYTSMYKKEISKSEYDEFDSICPTQSYLLYTDYTSTISLEYDGPNDDQVNTYKNLYMAKNNGTLQCDVDLLIKLFGKNGNINIIAGDIKNQEFGVIVTDYFIDSLNKKPCEDYTSYIGKFYNTSTKYQMNNIIAIIETGYKEKYCDLIAYYNNKKGNLNNHDDFDNFVMDAFNYYSINYSINPNYGKIVSTSMSSWYRQIYKCDISNSNITINTNITTIYDGNNEYNLNSNEVAMSLTKYNQLFGTSLTKKDIATFKPHNLTITKNLENHPISETKKEVLLSRLIDTETSNIFCGEEAFIKMSEISVFASNIYFESTMELDKIEKFALLNGYVIRGVENSKNIMYINIAVGIMNDFIVIIIILFLLSITLYLISIFIKNIKNNIYEIGILKSLGIRLNIINRLFLWQNLLMGLILIILSIFGMYFISVISNIILVEAFSNVFTISITVMKIIYFRLDLVILLLLIVLFTVFITSFIPNIYLNKVKPVNILKAKE